MKIEINEETYQNLKHCIERTAHMWDPGIDLWPFDIISIVEKYETTWSNNDFKSHVLPLIYSDKYQITDNEFFTDKGLSALFKSTCPKCGSNNLKLSLWTKGNTYQIDCFCGYNVYTIIG